MKTKRRRVVVIGQCAFTWMFLEQLVSSGARVDFVLVADAQEEEDPFVGLEIGPNHEWLLRHRIYIGGWREELRRLCYRNGITLILSAHPFVDLPVAEILVVAGLARRVPTAILERFGDWALNVHPSLLPLLGGPQPEAQAILQDLKVTGVTIHTMNERFDDGPIRYQKGIKINQSDDVWDLEHKAAACAAKGLGELIALEVLPERVGRGSGSYFSWYDRETVLDLRNCTSVDEVKKRLRLRPEGWAYFEIDGRRFFPIQVADDIGRGQKLELHLPHDHLRFSIWIEQQPTGGLRIAEE